MAERIYGRNRFHGAGPCRVCPLVVFLTAAKGHVQKHWSGAQATWCRGSSYLPRGIA